MALLPMTAPAHPNVRLDPSAGHEPVRASQIDAGAIAAIGISAALQAVDGVALKRMVDVWAASPAASKALAFQAAFAVRQIEVGLAAMTSIGPGRDRNVVRNCAAR